MLLKDALPKILGPLPGPRTEAVLLRRRNAVPDAIGNVYPVVIRRGEGAMIEDLDGNILLDWVGGVGVLNIGYSRPEVIEAVKNQSDLYFHAMANILTHEGYIALAEKLNSIVPVRGNKKRTFFVNSGAEADENMVKIARAYTKRPNIIVFTGAFHGRTLLTMAMTAKKAYARGMGPFPDGVYRSDFPYLYRRPEGMTEEKAVNWYVKRIYETFDFATPAESVAAIVIEPVQGEGGFIPVPIEWVKAVRKICDDCGILLAVDEVQTGWCRTGRMFAANYWQEAGCSPDIMSMAKSLGAGIPIGAVTAREEIMQSVAGGVIGGTFGGNAVACAAALKTIEIMEKERLADRAVQIGEKIKTRYEEWKKLFSCIGDVRGLGAMIGIEFVKDRNTKEPWPELVAAIIQDNVRQGLITENCGIYGNCIRFLAPLVITDEQIEAGLEIFEKSIKNNIKL